MAHQVHLLVIGIGHNDASDLPQHSFAPDFTSSLEKFLNYFFLI